MAGNSGIEQELADKIAYAKRIHAKAHDAMADWEQLYKGEYETPKDVADSEITAYKPSKTRAIVAKMLALLNLRAKTVTQVVPRRDTQAEDQVCTRLERYLEGYQWRIQSEKKAPIFRHAVQWGLLRGKTVLLAQYVPRFVGTEFFPIRSIAPDPKTIFEVPGENGIMYFVRESTRYAMELRREIGKRMAFESTVDSRQSTDKSKNKGVERGVGRWQMPSWLADKKGIDPVKVTEYFDGEYYAVLMDGELVLPPAEHGYGFCPIAVQYLEDTPFPEMEWRGQAAFAAVADALKNYAILMAKMGDAVSTLFWPDILVESPDGRAFVLNSRNAASVNTIPPGSKVTVLTVTPNMPILQNYAEMLQSDVNIATLPEVAYGLRLPSGGQSGFAISQVLSQVMDRIQDKKENMQFALGTHFEHVLRLTATFSDRAEGHRFEVLANMDQRSPIGETGGKRIRKLIGIGREEVDDHYQVLSQITPILPTEKMALIQQMNLLREPNKLTGLPMVDDDSLREMHPEVFENPGQVAERVGELYWRKQVPQIEQWEREEYLEQWAKEHPPHVPKGLEINALSKAELVERLAMLQMMIENPQALAEALGKGSQLATAGGASTVASGQTGVPMPGQPGEMPPGIPSGVLPPQMASGNPDPLQGQTPEGLAAEQMAGNG